MPPKATSGSQCGEAADHRDGGYAWVALTCCVSLQLLSLGIVFSAGVLYVELLDAFDGSKEAAALVGSLHTGFIFLPGPLVSLLLRKMSHRSVAMFGSLTACIGLLGGAFAKNLWTIYITYGIMGGTGFCMAYIAAATLPAEYFNKRRNLAFAIGSVGGGVGTLIMPQVTGLLVEALTWRGALIILAGLALQMSVIAALMRPPPAGERPQGPTLSLVLRVCLSRHFVALRLNSLLFNFGDMVLFVLVADYGMSKGASERDSIWLLSLAGLFSAVGRLVVATSGTCHCHRKILYVTACFLSGVAIAVVPLYDNYIYWSTCVSIFGLFFGVQLANYAIVTAEVMGEDKFELAYGLLMMTDGLGALAGPPFAGWLYAAVGGYEPGFYAGGAATAVAALLLLPTALGCDARLGPLGRQRGARTAAAAPPPPLLVRSAMPGLVVAY